MLHVVRESFLPSKRSFIRNHHALDRLIGLRVFSVYMIQKTHITVAAILLSVRHVDAFSFPASVVTQSIN